jgi:diguanylate cyclase (GGDEF)-like protein
VLGRWGGEEFMVVCTNTSGANALAVAEQLRVTLEEHSFQELGRCTASFGVSAIREEDTFEKLIGRADKSLYIAKKKGRNRVESID